MYVSSNQSGRGTGARAGAGTSPCPGSVRERRVDHTDVRAAASNLQEKKVTTSNISTTAQKTADAMLAHVRSMDDREDFSRPKRVRGVIRSGASRNFGAKLNGLITAVEGGEAVVVDDTYLTTGKWESGKQANSDRLKACGGDMGKANRATPAAVLAALTNRNRQAIAGTGQPLYLTFPIDDKGNATDLPAWNTTAKAVGCNALGFGGRFAVITTATYAAVKATDAAE